MVPKKQLIYADDLIKIMRAEDIRYQDVPWSTTAVAKLCEPMTVDAVEVVRCKDCKHWHEETGWCDHHSYFVEDGEPCHPWESSEWKMLNAEDFCSYGERKDNGRIDR